MSGVCQGAVSLMEFVKRRSTAVAAFAVATVAALGGCTSQPKAKAVAQDLVENLAGLTAAQRTCMLERLDAYSTDEIQADRRGERRHRVDVARKRGVAEVRGRPQLLHDRRLIRPALASGRRLSSWGVGRRWWGRGRRRWGQRRRETMDRVRSSFIALSSSWAGREMIVPSAIMRR